VVTLEKVRVLKVGLSDDGMSVGMKTMLKVGSVVRRGVVMLAPENVNVLGGKVGTWDKIWRDGRMERLKRALEQGHVEGAR
jgi:hypothetical protein